MQAGTEQNPLGARDEGSVPEEMMSFECRLRMLAEKLRGAKCGLLTAYAAPELANGTSGESTAPPAGLFHTWRGSLLGCALAGGVDGRIEVGHSRGVPAVSKMREEHGRAAKGASSSASRDGRILACE